MAVVRQRGADSGAYGEEEDKPTLRVPRQNWRKLVDTIENMCIILFL
jgi:hypothetical protein